MVNHPNHLNGLISKLSYSKKQHYMQTGTEYIYFPQSRMKNPTNHTRPLSLDLMYQTNETVDPKNSCTLFGKRGKYRLQVSKTPFGVSTISTVLVMVVIVVVTIVIIYAVYYYEECIVKGLFYICRCSYVICCSKGTRCSITFYLPRNRRLS